MNKYNTRQKYGTGWFNESHRHSLARQGVKTGRKDYAKLTLNFKQPIKSEYNYEKFNKDDFRVGFSTDKDVIIGWKTSYGLLPIMKIDWSKLSENDTKQLLEKKLGKKIDNVKISKRKETGETVVAYKLHTRKTWNAVYLPKKKNKTYMWDDGKRRKTKPPVPEPGTYVDFSGKVGKVVKTGKGYGILAEFEIGDTGEYAQRMLVSNISQKKASELLDKWKKGEIK
jgi:hypothetical protein